MNANILVSSEQSSLTAAPFLPPSQTQNTVSLKRQETEPFGLNWTSYSTAALHDIVTDSIKELTVLTRRGQAELRQRLLPALQEVRRRIVSGEEVEGLDSMTAYLAYVGLHEGVVRLWEFRLREKELKALQATNIESEPEQSAEISDISSRGEKAYAEAHSISSDEPRLDHVQAIADGLGVTTKPALPKKEYAPNTRGSHKVLQELAAQVQAKYGEGTCSVTPMPEGSPINNGVVLLTIPVSVTRAQTLLKESL